MNTKEITRCVGTATLTANARQAIETGEKIAQRYGDMVRSEHVLYGLTAVESMWGDDETIRPLRGTKEQRLMEIQRTVMQSFKILSELTPPSKSGAYAPQLKKVLRLAKGRAKFEGSAAIGTRHLMVAMLLHESEGGIAILGRCAIDLTYPPIAG